MERKNTINKFLIVLAFFTVALLGTFIMPSANNAIASGGSLEIAGPDKILTSESHVEFSATLINSSYGLENIEWFYNNTSISQIYYSEGTTTHTSILRLEDSFYGSGANTSAKISARINVGGVEIYNAEKTVVIESATYSVSIYIDGNTSQSFNETGEYEPFLFRISYPSTPAENVTWFLLEGHNKYNPLSPQAFGDRYSLSVYASGTYTVIAKVGDNFSNQATAVVEHKPVNPSEFLLSYKVLGKSSLGFDIYEFSITGIDKEHDLDSISWYRRGYNTPLQYGGDTFVFEPNSYATYQIFAKYEGAHYNLESNSFVVEIKIDRTKDIFIFTSIVVGVMAVGLVILIYRNIKKDKIWWVKKATLKNDDAINLIVKYLWNKQLN